MRLCCLRCHRELTTKGWGLHNFSCTKGPKYEEARKRGALGLVGHEVTLETREKLRLAKLNIPNTPGSKIKCSNTLKGREITWIDKIVAAQLGKPKPRSKDWYCTDEARNHYSEAAKRRVLENGPSYPKAYFVSELGHKVRSSYEKRVGLILKKLNLVYDYERPYTIIDDQQKKRYYYPDFVIEDRLVLEPKGFFKAEWDIRKLELFQEQYPDLKLIVIVEQSSALLKQQFKFIVMSFEQVELYLIELFDRKFKTI